MKGKEDRMMKRTWTLMIGLTLVSAAACSGQPDMRIWVPMPDTSQVVSLETYSLMQGGASMPTALALSMLRESAGSLIDLSLYRDLTPMPAPVVSDIRMDLAAQMAARTDAIHSCASQTCNSVQQMFAGSGLIECPRF
jgi:hypothetical protein